MFFIDWIHYHPEVLLGGCIYCRHRTRPVQRFYSVGGIRARRSLITGADPCRSGNLALSEFTLELSAGCHSVSTEWDCLIVQVKPHSESVQKKNCRKHVTTSTCYLSIIIIFLIFVRSCIRCDLVTFTLSFYAWYSSCKHSVGTGWYFCFLLLFRRDRYCFWRLFVDRFGKRFVIPALPC